MDDTGGCALADFDGDGWVDFVGARSGLLYRNQGGEDWELLQVMPPNLKRYGCSAGDYDNDGLPDFATEPRENAGEIMKLMRNEGGLIFIDVGADPNIVDVPPSGDTETNCWADVDFDGNLDLVVPAYPPWAFAGPGNFFLRNLGPTGPGGEYRFAEAGYSSGLDNPPGTERPEGAEFCDIDGDGDLDFFSNGTLYQNVSSLGAPRFSDVSDNVGLGFRDVLDEGACIFDHDMDGDFDLAVLYCGGTRVRIHENRGDGSFELMPQGFIESPPSVCFAMSPT